MSVRPETVVFDDVLQAARFTTLFYGHFELGAPWALEVPAKPTSSFYIVARGGAQLKLKPEILKPENLKLKPESEAVTLAPGDLVLLPRGQAHRLSDGSRSKARPMPSAELQSGTRLGGPGPATTLVSGCFRFSLGTEHPLLRGLPNVLLFRGDDPARSAALAATVSMLVAESSSPTAGSSIVLGRLTDVLFVHALRLHASTLPMLRDPPIAKALSLIHERPGDAWAVHRLASAVGLSRTGFMQRFQSLVGEPPLRYLTKWRMLLAASALSETTRSVEEIGASLGYESAAAFQKAFKRWQGLGPGGYRRASRPAILSA